MPDIPPTTSEGMLDDDALYEEQYGEPRSESETNGCPWCDDYGGEHVNRHAPKAHPEEWEGYNA